MYSTNQWILDQLRSKHFMKQEMSGSGVWGMARLHGLMCSPDVILMWVILTWNPWRAEGGVAVCLDHLIYIFFMIQLPHLGPTARLHALVLSAIEISYQRHLETIEQ